MAKIRNKSGRIVDVPDRFLYKAQKDGWEIVKDGFVCDICGKEFKSERALRGHKLGAHKKHA